MTQSRKDALQELLAKVEAGDIQTAPFWKIWTPESKYGQSAYDDNQRIQRLTRRRPSTAQRRGARQAVRHYLWR